MLRPSSRATKTLPSRSAASSWVRERPPGSTRLPAASRRSSAARASRALRSASSKVDATTPPASSRTTAASTCEEISVRSASALAASIEEKLTEAHTAAVRRPFSHPVAKFYRDRGPHLAAMIAYFGLLSSVSLIFLALALLGFTGRAEESSYLVEELGRLFPERPIGEIVDVVETITENATTLGVIGLVFLLWTSLSLFSVLESAFNIVYGLPNRPFLQGKGLATVFMAGSLIVLFAALVIGSIGFDLLRRFAPG